MFSRYFGDRYFSARFWPNLGGEIVLVEASPDYVVMVEASQQYVVVPPFEGVSTVSTFTTEVIPR